MQIDPRSTKLLIEEFEGNSPEDCLHELSLRFPGQVVFSTSFGLEDQFITHLIATNNIQIGIFTLDTGRLFPETYSTWEATVRKYKVPVNAYYPDDEALNSFVSQNGPNCFYDSVQHRKTCCSIRKVEPLKKALMGNKIWVTGIRASQSQNRETMKSFEWDESNGIIKYHPLLRMEYDEVRQQINKKNIPYNPLHDKGFVSIGCAPCTRAIRDGEDFRAGRWWWEDESKKECGLHIHHTGKK